MAELLGTPSMETIERMKNRMPQAAAGRQQQQQEGGAEAGAEAGGEVGAEAAARGAAARVKVKAEEAAEAGAAGEASRNARLGATQGLDRWVVPEHLPWPLCIQCGARVHCHGNCAVGHMTCGWCYASRAHSVGQGQEVNRYVLAKSERQPILRYAKTLAFPPQTLLKHQTLPNTAFSNINNGRQSLRFESQCVFPLSVSYQQEGCHVLILLLLRLC